LADILTKCLPGPRLRTLIQYILWWGLLLVAITDTQHGDSAPSMCSTFLKT
jgi:hypothetical protein